MNFTQVEPNENYRVKRMLSEGGVWEFGIYPTLFGFRVAAGVVGQHTYSINYCCGDDGAWLIQVAVIVLAILDKLPETTQSWQAERLFPRQYTKPMANDPGCWEQLNHLLDCVSRQAEEDHVKKSTQKNTLNPW